MKIFIVDDDIEQRMIMADFLAGPDDTLHEFCNGKAMLDALDGGPDHNPDLVLLDVEMPEMDGITACRLLRERGLEHVQVIFISAHDDMETRLATYGAGGSDFVVKPFMPIDLIGKVAVARTLRERHDSFVSDIQTATATAFTAMSSMGELGVVLQFLRASFSCANLDALAAALIGAIGEYGLSGTVELRAGPRELAYASRGECTPLERSVLAHARNLERIFRFRSQMAINYPHVTFVILNLPDDEERIGRLRDHLAALAEGADARVVALLAEEERQAKSRAILTSASSITHALTTIDRQQEAHRLQLLNLGEEYLNELTRAFRALGLSEPQEAELYALAQQATQRTSAVVNHSNDMAAQLRDVAKQLRALV